MENQILLGGEENMFNIKIELRQNHNKITNFHFIHYEGLGLDLVERIVVVLKSKKIQLHGVRMRIEVMVTSGGKGRL